MAWAERHEPWHRGTVAYCEVTGQLLPRRHWTFEHDGATMHVRDPSCEELFRRYVLPRRQRRPENAQGRPAKEGTG